MNAGGSVTADVYCEAETITQVAPGLDPGQFAGAEIIDAAGKYVFPGFIDPHVHIYLPFMGTFSKDTHETGSQAALVGGTTTIIEMCCPSRSEAVMDAFELWHSKADGAMACDYTFHIGVTRYDGAGSDHERQLRKLVEDIGMTSFKVFLAYKGAFGVTDDELYHTCRLAAELNATVTAHCENADLVAALQQKLLAEGRVGPQWHEPSRPVAVEAEGVHHFCTFLQMTGAKGYVVHTSNRPAVENADRFRQRGVEVKVETVIPYLVLDHTYAEKPDFEGAKYVMSPPIRSKEHQQFLWQALADGRVDTVGTDHAPFDFLPQKHMGHYDADKCVDANFEPTGQAGNFTLIPNGIPSVENRVTLLYSHGVHEGRIGLERFVDVASTQAAKIFGLYPRKGVVVEGADADLVVWDPGAQWTVRAADQLMNVDYSGFEGWPMHGRPSVVTVRGEVAARDGRFTGTVGRGNLLRRST